MRLSFCSAAVVSSIALLVGSAFGQVRLGPTGPYTPVPLKKPTSLGQRGPFAPLPDVNQPETFKIAITPAPEPDLPLKYALLPKYEHVKPGNSVPFYYRALLNWKERPAKYNRWLYDDYDRWANTPIAEFPKEEIRKLLTTYGLVFEELSTAAHRETTDWSWRLQDAKGLDAVTFIISEAQESRNLARLLFLKARLETSEGRYDDAIKTLQTGNKLARDVAEPPTLINDLVGIAIAATMAANVREIIGSANSPNLYWALSKLPRPFIDMQPALRYEMALPMKLFPAMKDAETADHSPEEWSRMLTEAFLRMQQLRAMRSSRFEAKLQFEARLAVTGLVLMGYPRVKRDLIAWGYDAKRVESMPVGQAIAIHQSRTYRYMYQEMMKWSNLPSHQALAGLRDSTEKLKRERYLAPGGQSREIIPLAALLLPAVTQAQLAGARLDSRIAGLQVLEAIRMHAAKNGGKLPQSLADIREVPVPVNPLTAQPFPYHFAADKAVLEIPTPAGNPASVGWRFEISVRK